MNQPIPTGPDLFGFGESAFDKARAAGQMSGNDTYGSPEELYQFRAAQHFGMQAQTAALVMLTEVIAAATGTFHVDLDAWREKIGMTWLKECRSKEQRRPQCAERHTEDCAYADPIPEPKHVLLPVGTRVLVSDPHGANCGCGNEQPWVGIVRGYDMHRTKYEISGERYGTPGEYYDFTRWAFADNRVQPHPEQSAPEQDPDMAKLLARFERKWSCGVGRSGYHNGVDCTPGDRHDGWGCGYVWQFPLLTDKGAREIGLTPDTEDTQ